MICHVPILHFSCRRKCNIWSSVILYTDELFNGKIKSTGVDVIYMDFKKAFDVSHNALLSKLQGFGITGNLQNWLTTYLEHNAYVSVTPTLIIVRCSQESHRVAFWAYCYSVSSLTIYHHHLNIPFFFSLLMTQRA